MNDRGAALPAASRIGPAQMLGTGRGLAPHSSLVGSAALRVRLARGADLRGALAAFVGFSAFASFAGAVSIVDGFGEVCASTASSSLDARAATVSASFVAAFLRPRRGGRAVSVSVAGAVSGCVAGPVTRGSAAATLSGPACEPGAWEVR